MNDRLALRYFRLFPDVLLVTDTQGDGLLYLLAERKAIELGPRTTRILEDCEKNMKIADVAADLQLPVEAVSQFVASLAEKEAGCFMESACYVEKVRAPDPLSKVSTFGAPFVLDRIRLTLSDFCTERCHVCTENEHRSSLLPCVGCTKKSRDTAQSVQLGIQRVRKALSEAAYLDCRCLLLTVGSTGHIEELLFQTIESAHANGFQSINLFLGAPAPETLIRKLVRLNIDLTFQVFAFTEEEHNRRFGRPDAWTQLTRNLEMLQAFQKPFDLLFVAETESLSLAPQIAALSQMVGSRRIMVDCMRNSGGLDRRCPSHPWHFSNPGLSDFIAWIEEGTCVHQALTLNADGHYHSCPVLLDSYIGHVDDMTVAEVMTVQKKRDRSGEAIAMSEKCLGCTRSLACRMCHAKSIVG